MNRIIIITGASSGLGYEMACQALADNSFDKVVSISRSCVKESLEGYKDKYREIIVDFSSPVAVSGIFENLYTLVSDYENIIFVNNAGVITPISGIGKYDAVDIEISVAVNATSPALLVNHLLARCRERNLTLVNISSGAAKSPIEGWALYCSSKAYMKMYFDVLQTQVQQHENIIVIQIDPGVMDTKMQQVIRNADETFFPRLDDFKSLHEQDKLVSPTDAASHILKQISGH